MYKQYLILIFLTCCSVQAINFEEIIKIDKIHFLKKIQSYLQSYKIDQCSGDVQDFLTAVQDGKDWGIEMLDASAKIPSGLLMGNIVELGNYDECMAVQGISSEGLKINPQHCMLYISFSESQNTTKKLDRLREMRRELAMPRAQMLDLPNVFSLGFGFCLPASCSIQQILDFFNSQITIDPNQIQLSMMCTWNETKPFNVVDWIAIFIFSIFGGFLICSTAYDLYLRYRDKRPDYQIMLAFSMFTNGEKLLSINTPSNKNDGSSISCIHGLRALSISWVVLAHRYNFGIEQPLVNLLHVKDWISQYHSAIITGGSVSVDTFFTMSGLLLSYIFMKHMSRGKRRFNIFSFYIHRYLRLTPPYAAMILLQSSLLIYMADGPLWNKLMPYYTKFCTDYFWSALLYIQTAYNSMEICVVQSWYLQADMQMYVFSPLILLPMIKWPKYFIAGSVILLIASVGIIFCITFFNEFSGAISDMDTFGGGDQIKYLYFPMYTRYGPWLAGILVGYILHNIKNQELKLNMLLVVLLWFICLAAMGAIVFGSYPFYQLERQKNVLEASFYQGLSKICWGFSICWIIFACSTGYGGPINWFLSLGYWQPISRLSYCIYLTHYQLQVLLMHSVKIQGYFSDINMIHAFIGDMGLSILISIFWSLAFESPVTVIEKILQGSNKNDTKTTASNGTSHEQVGIENSEYVYSTEDIRSTKN